MTAYKGIDYGMGQTNIDKETGIRYGVINQKEVLQAWVDSSEASWPCKGCEYSPDDDCGQACNMCEPTSYFIDDNEYQAECGEDGDIFISKSPYYTFAQFCSPCAPGACYLINPLDILAGYPAGGHNKAGVPIDNNRAYCFGHDWFRDTETKKAPYPVYRVSDNQKVN